MKFSVRRECKVEVEREVDGEEEIMLVRVGMGSRSERWVGWGRGKGDVMVG